MLQQPAPTNASFYELETEVRLTANFFIENTDMMEDPTEVTLYVLNPAGVQMEYTYAAGQITRDGLGQYQYSLLTDMPGTWLYKWQGMGSLVVMSRDVKLIVRPTAFAIVTTLVPNAGILTYTGNSPTVTL
jgi:hypothetical protein